MALWIPLIMAVIVGIVWCWSSDLDITAKPRKSYGLNKISNKADKNQRSLLAECRIKKKDVFEYCLVPLPSPTATVICSSAFSWFTYDLRLLLKFHLNLRERMKKERIVYEPLIPLYKTEFSNHKLGNRNILHLCWTVTSKHTSVTIVGRRSWSDLHLV